MSLCLELTKKGKPNILFKNNKYREGYTIKSGEVVWRCLGRTCSATIKTNADKTEVTETNNKHSGPHPVTMRSLLSPRNSPNSTPKAESDVTTNTLVSNGSTNNKNLSANAHSTPCVSPPCTSRAVDISHIEQLEAENNSLQERITILTEKLRVVTDHAIQSDIRLISFTDQVFEVPDISASTTPLTLQNPHSTQSPSAVVPINSPSIENPSVTNTSVIGNSPEPTVPTTDIPSVSATSTGPTQERSTSQLPLERLPQSNSCCDDYLEIITALKTTIQVLEAEIDCLRNEKCKCPDRESNDWMTVLPRRNKPLKTSTNVELMTELSAANSMTKAKAVPQKRRLQKHQKQSTEGMKKKSTPDASALPSFFSPPSSTKFLPHSTPQKSVQPRQNKELLRHTLLIGDSHLKHSTKICKEQGAFIECCPGGKIVDIKNRLLNYLDVDLSVIYFHVGCNNLRRGYRGGPGYSGGHGKREVLHSMADLLFTARKRFPNSKLILNSVLIRQDIGYKALYDFNYQLELMCDNFGVTFVEANCVVGRGDLVRDGVHFNRRGVSRLGHLFADVITSVLQSLDASQVSLPCDQGEVRVSVPSPAAGLGLGTVDVAGHSVVGSDCGIASSAVPGN